MRDYTPYLQNEKFDLRFKKAVEIIGSVKDKSILDLNCGTARMLLYMQKDFDLYIGNDINEDLLEVAKKRNVERPVTFILCRDDEILDHLTRIDIFMCFGINPGVNKGIESETEFETFERVVRKFLPEIVVCEGWTDYEKDHKIISQRANFLKPLSYREIGSFFMTNGMLRTLKVYRKE